MSNIFITRETVASARNTLPPAHLSSKDVMEVKVTAEDGEQAIVEFERIHAVAGDGKPIWSWEAMTCWKT